MAYSIKNKLTHPTKLVPPNPRDRVVLLQLLMFAYLIILMSIVQYYYEIKEVKKYYVKLVQPNDETSKKMGGGIPPCP